MLLVTGGAGFIGSSFILDWLAQGGEPVANLDKLTYAGNPRNLAALDGDARYRLLRADICDRAAVDRALRGAPPARRRALRRRDPRRPLDRRPGRLHPDQRRRHVQPARRRARALARAGRRRAASASASCTSRPTRFTARWDRTIRRSPRPRPTPRTSPYSASKAGSDHLVRAYHHTYGLPVVTTNCSNNYGPYQFPEKLIPLMILNALEGKPLPVYGDGGNVRDWLYVDDHCAAIRRVLERGRPARPTTSAATANARTSTWCETLCDIARRAAARAAAGSYRMTLDHVRDRPARPRPPLRHRRGEDRARARLAAGARPSRPACAKTVRWYLDNADWVRSRSQTGAYRDWVDDRTTRGRGDIDERHHPRRRLRHAAAIPLTQVVSQAAAAGLRQADDLLPADRR